eukprot:2015855-Pyramimonas_sp.AAC.1
MSRWQHSGGLDRRERSDGFDRRERSNAKGGPEGVPRWQHSGGFDRRQLSDEPTSAVGRERVLNIKYIQVANPYRYPLHCPPLDCTSPICVFSSPATVSP